MIVCSCRAVTERTVGAAIASGASCVESIAEKCGAGSRCGGCWPELARLVATHLADRQLTSIEQAASAA